MLDHFGGGERAEPAAGAIVGAAREAGKKAGGEQIAGAGGVDHALDRKGRHRFGPVRADHQTALLAARHHRGARYRRATPSIAVSKSAV